MEDVVRIKLGNRWRVSNELVQSVKDKNKFYLIFGDPKEWDWCRVLFKEGETDYNCKDFFAVDPSGGPFMALGNQIEDYVIERISEEEMTKEEYPLLSEQKIAFTFYMKHVKPDEPEVVYTVEQDDESVILDKTINAIEYAQTSTLDI